MIDLFGATIDIQHNVFGNTRFIKDEGSSIMTAKQFTKKVRLSPGAAQIDVTSLNNGTQIAVRGCPAKPLQGHNVFGTDNVRGLVYNMIMYVLAALNITPTPAQAASWEQGEFDLDEIHITYRLAVDSHAQVGRLLAHLLRNVSIKLRAAPLESGTGIRLRNPVTGALWIMYDKLREFNDKRTREGRYLEAITGPAAAEINLLLRQEATSNIRSELKLDKKYLSKNGLDTGSAWTKAKVRSVYLEEMALLKLGDVSSISYAEQLLDRLEDKKLRQTFLAWMHDEDLSQLHESQTLNSRRKAIITATGIDIKLERVPLEEFAVAVADIFAPDNILPNFPEWADDHPEVAYRGQELAIDD